MTTAPAAPLLGPDGQRCPQCAEELRGDQRYCLNCGRRRAAMRLPFLDVVGPDGPHAAPPAPAPSLAARGGTPERSPLVALGVLVALLLALGIGVVIGRGAGDTELVARAPVVNVSAAPAAGAAAAAPVISDWPAGTSGWTVALRTLPASAAPAEVAQARQDATGAGAAAVGVLRSDEFGSLPGGEIVVYSGIFRTKAAATKALPGLRKNFAKAKVVRVAPTRAGAAAPPAAASGEGTSAKPATGSGLSPQEYQKRSKKLPDEVESEGTAPPADGKAPGGGSGEATEIG